MYKKYKAHLNRLKNRSVVVYIVSRKYKLDLEYRRVSSLVLVHFLARYQH